MKANPPRTIHFRRKRELRTNYKKRLHLLLSKKPRLVVRFTNQQIIAQVITFTGKGDEVIAAVTSRALVKMGWNYSCKNIPAAYLTGMLIARRALKEGCNDVIFDTGLLFPLHKGKVYAFLKGAIDAGLGVPAGDESIFPSHERISGKHIEGYGTHLLHVGKDLHDRQFSQYLKNAAKPETLSTVFKTVQQKIQGL